MTEKAAHFLKHRYSRQILFAPIGEGGQKKLGRSRVAIVGLGALGSVNAQLLARAGVGYLRLIDRDYVEFSNLHRQILFDEEDARQSRPKAIAAQTKLRTINSEVSYEARTVDVNSMNVLDLLSGVDVILDATDNLETRFLINEAAIKTNVPWIYGGCAGSVGMTYVIIPGNTACLSCFAQRIQGSGALENCGTVGVISPVAGVVASMQVAEALKYLTGAYQDIDKHMRHFDLWNNRFTVTTVAKKSNCVTCG